VSNEIPRVLREQARYQAGVITRAQALKSDMPVKAIRWKLERRAWRQVYRGVYVTFTGPVTREAQLWAAVLYAGQGGPDSSSPAQRAAARSAARVRATPPITEP
jgi:hypothetical protein